MTRRLRRTSSRLPDALTAGSASATEPEPYTFEISLDNAELHTRLVSSAIDHCVEPAGMTAAIISSRLLGMFVTLNDRWPQPEGVPAASKDKACPRIGNRYRIRTPSSEIRKMLDAETTRSGQTRADIIAALFSLGLRETQLRRVRAGTVH